MQIDNITSERGDLAGGQRSEGFDQLEGKVTERKSNYDCGAIKWMHLFQYCFLNVFQKAGWCLEGLSPFKTLRPVSHQVLFNTRKYTIGRL